MANCPLIAGRQLLCDKERYFFHSCSNPQFPLTFSLPSSYATLEFSALFP
jgi:hypothetical protein